MDNIKIVENNLFVYRQNKSAPHQKYFILLYFKKDKFLTF